MLLTCSVGEDSWESLGLQGDQTGQFLRKLILNIHRKDWCWSWSSNTLATWCEELTYLKRPWCWERLRAGEGDDRGWDCWMASLTQWTWVWVSSGSWWRTGKPGLLQSVGLQIVERDWATELTEPKIIQPLSYQQTSFFSSRWCMFREALCLKEASVHFAQSLANSSPPDLLLCGIYISFALERWTLRRNSQLWFFFSNFPYLTRAV